MYLTLAPIHEAGNVGVPIIRQNNTAATNV